MMNQQDLKNGCSYEIDFYLCGKAYIESTSCFMNIRWVWSDIVGHAQNASKW